jgi:hypothetical protein
MNLFVVISSNMGTAYAVVAAARLFSLQSVGERVRKERGCTIKILQAIFTVA